MNAVAMFWPRSKTEGTLTKYRDLAQTKMGTPEAYLHNTPGVDCSSPQVLQASWPKLPADGADCQVLRVVVLDSIVVTPVYWGAIWMQVLLNSTHDLFSCRDLCT